MTNYGFCFRPVLHRDDCSGFLHLWIEDSRGRTCFIPTSYDICHDEWDPFTGWLTLRETSGQRLLQLRQYAEGMAHDLDTLGHIIADLEFQGKYKASDIINRWNNEMALV